MKVPLDSALKRVLQLITLPYHKKLLKLNGKTIEAEFVLEAFSTLHSQSSLNAGRTPDQISDRAVAYLKQVTGRRFELFDPVTKEFTPPFGQLFDLAKYCWVKLSKDIRVIKNLITAYQYPEENQIVIDTVNRRLNYEIPTPGATATPNVRAGAFVPNPDFSVIQPPSVPDLGADGSDTVENSETLLPSKDSDIDKGEPEKVTDNSGDSPIKEQLLQIEKVVNSIVTSPVSVKITMTGETVRVPDDWHANYCDKNAKPGQDALKMNNFTCYLVQPRKSEDAENCFSIADDKGDEKGVQGSAVYVETQSLRAFKIGLSDVMAMWAQIASLYCELLAMNLELKGNVDVNTMSAIDKKEYAIAYSLVNKLIAAKAELTTKAAVLNDYLFTESLTPFALFVTFTTQKVNAVLPKWQRWLNLRKGTGMFTQDVDGTLRLNESINTTGMNNTASVAFNTTLNRKKLPEIQLKSFDGKTENFLRWAADWEAYFKKYNDAGVIDYYMMMSYLRQSMPDNYRKEMDTLSWDKIGYDSWMAELSRRHGSPVIQAMTYRKRMQTAPKPKDTLESFADFRRYVTKCVNGLELSGIKVSDELNSESDQWLSYISPKLSPTMKQSWTIHKSIQTTHDPKAFEGKAIFRFFLEWMAQYETTLRMDHIETELMNSNPHTRRHEKGNSKKVKTHATKVSTRVTALGTKATKPKKPPSNQKKGGQQASQKGCAFCNGNHFSGDCRAPIDKEVAMKQVFAKGLCTNCLRGGHKANECRSTKTCPHKTAQGGQCTQKHHPLLHGCRFVTRQGGKKKGKGKSPKRQ